MGEEGRAIVLALLSGVGLTGFFLAVGAFFPGVVEPSRRAADRSPGRSFVVGLVNWVFLGALGLGFSALADSSGVEFFQLLTVLAFSLLAILLAYGLTGLSQLAGTRLIPTAHPVWQQVLGSWALILGGLTPFVGWFLLFPYFSIVAVGAVLLGWVRSRGRPPQAHPETEAGLEVQEE